jgi:ATPase subunit of ABC transporter with duplicated ATPase domains
MNPLITSTSVTFQSLLKALNAYDGAMILVSHVPEFVKEIKIDETIDLGLLK